MIIPKISAQSTILHRQMPDICLNNPLQNQILIWDETRRALVNINITDIDFNRPGAVTDIRLYNQIGNGTQQSFVIPWATSNPDSLIITIQGVKQQQSAYTILTNAVSTLVTLSEPLGVGEEMEIVGLIVEDESEIRSANFIADGSTSLYTVPWAARGAESLIITLDGVKQQTGAYTAVVIGGQTRIQFSGVPDTGVRIEVIGILGSDIETTTVSQGSLPSGLEFKSILITATGTQDTYLLPWTVDSVESIIVTLDGVKQQLSAYDIINTGSTTLLQFAGTPLSGESIEVIGIGGTFSSGGSLDVTDIGTGLSITDTTGSINQLDLKGIVGGSGISISDSGNDLTISVSDTNIRQVATNTYTLQLTDQFLVMGVSNVSTISIPNDSSITFPIGATIEIAQYNNNAVNVVPEAGVALTAKDNNFSTDGLGSSLRLIKINNNEWLLLR